MSEFGLLDTQFNFFRKWYVAGSVTTFVLTYLLKPSSLNLL
jgi:hypothetical protein